MKYIFLFSLLMFVLLPTDARQQGCAQSLPAEAPMTVTADWLKQNLNDPKLVLLHIGQKPEYDAGHIPGAQYVALQDLSTPPDPNALALELPTVEQIKPALERFGISNDSRIIVYFGKDWVSPTTRVYFTLDVFGLGGNTSILDGGMPAWVAAGGTLSKDVAARKPGTLKLDKNQRVIAQADFVKANLAKENVKIIDSRTANFYDGSNAGNMPRAGHIKGAKNIPFTSFTDETNKFKSDAEIRKLFSDAGVKPYDTIVTYCHIGQQGTVDYFAAKKAGFKVALYDGSFQEWSRLLDTPVENPSGDRAAPAISFVSPKWLEENAGAANVRVLDVRPNVYDYFAGHVPNAVHLADSAMRFPMEGYPTQYPETFLIGQLLSRAGVKKTDKVVLYSDADNVLGATMIAYLLERLGHSDIAIMDGGWRDYSVGSKASQEYPQYKAAPYDNLDNRSVRATLDDVKAAIGKTEIRFIDARAPEVYRGETKTWARNGHIPGAVNLPWKTLVESNNTHKLKPAADLKAAFASRGIKETDDIIVYCGTSREASLEYVILKHVLKFPKVRLYEGSWAEYSNHAQLPVESGAEKAEK
jgi:thiosulfate/3-mercaptopyruvate sulfurtransferase